VNKREIINKIIESQDIFNLRNSKIMEMGKSYTPSNNRYNRISSLQKRRQQRKTWKKKTKE